MILLGTYHYGNNGNIYIQKILYSVMPIPSINEDLDEFAVYRFYADKHFKIIAQAFDILTKHDKNILRLNKKLSKKIETNGARSFVLRI